MNGLTIRRESQQPAFAALYRRSGLELGEDWTEGAVYSAAARLGDTLLGAATVSHRLDRYILDYIAVEPDCRLAGVGRQLAERCLTWCREQDAEALWLAARTPGFFRALGAEETGGDALLRDCLSCPDYGRGCAPVEMKFVL